MPPKKLTAEGQLALLAVRHKRQAINIYVRNQLHKEDAAMGTADCEGRTIPTYKIHRDIIAPLIQPGDLDLILAFEEAHKGDKLDNQVHTEEEARGAKHDPAYDTMIQRFEDALIKAGVLDYVILNHCWSISGIFSSDEFENLFSIRSKGTWWVATGSDDPEFTARSAAPISTENDYKRALANMGFDMFNELYKEMDRHEEMVPNAPQYLIENQLMAASKNLRSSIEFKDGSDIGKVPLKPIFDQILTMGYWMFNNDCPLAVRVRLEKMTPNAAGLHSETYNGNGVVFFKPNKQTGRFDAYNPTQAELKENHIGFDCWGKRLASVLGTGLDAHDIKEVLATLAKTNIWWILLQYGATHPPYAQKAKKEAVDYAQEYLSVCMPQPDGVTEGFKPTREEFKEFHFKMNVPNEKRPNLLNLWTLATEQGQLRDLHNNCTPLHYTATDELFVRDGRPIDLQIDHILVITGENFLAKCTDLDERHANAPKAVFGPHVIRASSGGISCDTIENAQSLLSIKKDKQRRARAKEMYPNNALFIPV